MGNENKSLGNIRALIFDLDGTLIDSRLDLANAVNATRAHLGLGRLAEPVIFSYIGQGVQALVQRALGEGFTPQQIEQGMEYFLQYYRGHMLDHTVPYAGVREALTALAPWPMAVLTNKPAGFSRAILEGLGLAGHFLAIYGGNSFEKKKPDPMGVRALLEEFGIMAEEALIVGDSAIDMLTARNAGTRAAGVTYGLDPEGVRANPPDLLLESLLELPARLDRRMVEARRRTAERISTR
jgi:phosphoglycolate phosphatase